MLSALKTLARVVSGRTQTKLPVVCIFGRKDVALTTPIAADYEERRLDCRCYASEADLERVLVRDRPDVIITIGDRASFPRVTNAPFEIRKRWHHHVTPERAGRNQPIPDYDAVLKLALIETGCPTVPGLGFKGLVMVTTVGTLAGLVCSFPAAAKLGWKTPAPLNTTFNSSPPTNDGV